MWHTHGRKVTEPRSDPASCLSRLTAAVKEIGTQGESVISSPGVNLLPAPKCETGLPPLFRSTLSLQWLEFGAVVLGILSAPPRGLSAPETWLEGDGLALLDCVRELLA